MPCGCLHLFVRGRVGDRLHCGILSPVTDFPQSYRSKTNRKTRAMRRRSPCCIGGYRRTPASSSGIGRVYGLKDVSRVDCGECNLLLIQVDFGVLNLRDLIVVVVQAVRITRRADGWETRTSSLEEPRA